jgi:hypothetical protein
MKWNEHVSSRRTATNPDMDHLIIFLLASVATTFAHLCQISAAFTEVVYPRHAFREILMSAGDES